MLLPRGHPQLLLLPHAWRAQAVESSGRCPCCKRPLQLHLLYEYDAEAAQAPPPTAAAAAGVAGGAGGGAARGPSEDPTADYGSK
eukprot:6992644-Prymnesium_polylepis.1